MRAGRGRPRAAWFGLVTWLLVTLLWARWGPPGFLLLLVVAGVYLLGPLWTPVRYRVGDEGVERASPFARRTWRWDELGAWTLDAAERTAHLVPRGRGVARFLPPILLMWEGGAGAAEHAGRLEAWLRSRLGGAT